MMHSSSVLVIGGSVRARRICPQISEWVAEIGRQTIAAEFEVIDLKDWSLPIDDEPGIPALGEYACAHTRLWSRKVAEAGAVVFVTPQYNWGYPAPLKNALDHLYAEWAGKPVAIVTYGGHGGDKCGRQLRMVAKGLKMRPVSPMPRLRLSHDRIKANTGVIAPASEFARYEHTVRRAMARLDAAMKRKGFLSSFWPL